MHFSGVLVATLVPSQERVFSLALERAFYVLLGRAFCVASRKERLRYFSEKKSVLRTSWKRAFCVYFSEKSVLRVLEEAFACTIGKAVLAIKSVKSKT
jgi:hypothetical protein